MKKIFLTVWSLMLLGVVMAQQGGQYVYPFLNFSYSSRIAALGGHLIAVQDDDLSPLACNPSLISKTQNNSLNLHFIDYFSDAIYASALYSRTFNKAGSFVADIQLVNYGSMTETDELGQELGKFTANDIALSVGWGRAIHKNFSIGANMKLIYCYYYVDNQSFGIAFDVAASYFNTDKNLALSFLVKNIGTEIVPFQRGSRQKLPFDLQFAFSQKLKHIPVRYHLSLHSLYRWKMYNISSQYSFYEEDAMTGDLVYPSKTARFFDNFFRHFIIGIEILPSKYFSLQAAFDFNRFQEMKIPQRRSIAGFSYGFIIHVHAIKIGFSRMHYAVEAVPNFITLSFNFDEMSKLKAEKKQIQRK